jgi:hypothetical protein
VVAAAVAVAGDARAIGETLHLVDPEPLSARELFGVLSREYAGRAPRGRLPPRLVEASLRVKRISELFSGIPPESIAYLNHPVVYDVRRALDLLEPHGLRPPRFEQYVDAMVRYFAEHEADSGL